VIVTITPTVMDGTVLRWYDADDPENLGHPVMSVSRNRVEVYEQDRIGPMHAEQAAKAYAELKADRYADVRRYATHARMRLAGALIPLKGGE